MDSSWNLLSVLLHLYGLLGFCFVCVFYESAADLCRIYMKNLGSLSMTFSFLGFSSLLFSWCVCSNSFISFCSQKDCKFLIQLFSCLSKCDTKSCKVSGRQPTVYLFFTVLIFLQFLPALFAFQCLQISFLNVLSSVHNCYLQNCSGVTGNNCVRVF